VAEAFAAQGGRVVVTATRVEHLHDLLATASAVGWDIRGTALDLRDARSVERAAGAALETLGAVDLLVNNAAVFGGRGSLDTFPPERVEEVIEVNLLGALRLVQALRSGLAPGAVVVNVTSGAAGQPGSAAYGLSKAGLEAATRMLRAELQPLGVTCLAIDPGAARTRMRAEACPDEDPLLVPPASERVAPFLAAAARAPSGWLVRAAPAGRRRIVRRALVRLVGTRERT
jgi:NAD(P)-dependent dehydrogenase (short-subunit alcohol dehydrogenase family)